MKKILGLLAVFGLLLSACSDSSDNAANVDIYTEEKDLNDDDTKADTEIEEETLTNKEQAIADKISQYILEDVQPKDVSILKPSEAACIGEGYLEEFGIERLEEADITANDASAIDNPDFTDNEVKKQNRMYMSCASVEDLLGATLQSNSELKTSDAKCIASEVNKDRIEDFLQDQNDRETAERFEAALGKAYETCAVSLPGEEQTAPTDNEKDIPAVDNTQTTDTTQKLNTQQTTTTTQQLPDIDEEQALADAIAKEFIVSFEINDDSVIGFSSANCIGKKYVEEIGVERFKMLGVTADNASAFSNNQLDFTDQERQKELQFIIGCIGIEKMATTFYEDGGINRNDAECISAKIDKNIAKEFFTNNDVDEESYENFYTESEKAAEECGVF